MRLDELAALVRRVDLSRFPLPMRLHLTTDDQAAPGLLHPTRVVLTIEMDVKLRGTGQQGRVLVEGTTELRALPMMNRERCLHWIHGHVTRAVQHELDECFEVDGGLPFDPHADDEPTERPSPRPPERDGLRKRPDPWSS